MADGVPHAWRRAEGSLSLQTLHQMPGPHAGGRKEEMAVATVSLKLQTTNRPETTNTKRSPGNTLVAAETRSEGGAA